MNSYLFLILNRYLHQCYGSDLGSVLLLFYYDFPNSWDLFHLANYLLVAIVYMYKNWILQAV